MTKNNKDLSKGPILQQLITLTWPMLFGMMGLVVFNLVDTYFVGMLGTRELAAISFCFPVIMFINSLSQGIGIGTGSLISRHIIASERAAVRLMASRAILLGMLIVLVFVLGGLLTLRPLFSLMGAEAELLDPIQAYMRIWLLGVPFVVLPMIGNNIIRATGDTFRPGMLMVGSAILNGVLDPLLIFGYGFIPAMGMQGAAIASVIARSFSAGFILYLLIHKEHLLTFSFGSVRHIIKTWNAILHIAGPATLGMLITPVSMGIITRIIAGFGKEAVAAFGVSSRIEMFVLMVVASLGSVLIIFIGQNISKEKYQRIDKALNYAWKFSLLWGLIVFVLLLFLATPIASLFSSDPRVIEIASQYFLIVGASYGFHGLVMLAAASFNGINKPYPSAVFSVIRMVGLYVPLAWIGSIFLGITGVFWAGFIANLTVGSAAFLYLYRTIGKIAGTRVVYPGHNMFTNKNMAINNAP